MVTIGNKTWIQKDASSNTVQVFGRTGQREGMIKPKS